MEEISTLIWDCKQSPHTDRGEITQQCSHFPQLILPQSLSLWITIHLCLSVSLSVCFT